VDLQLCCHLRWSPGMFGDRHHDTVIRQPLIVRFRNHAQILLHFGVQAPFCPIDALNLLKRVWL
jgi:hypothetical protein